MREHRIGRDKGQVGPVTPFTHALRDLDIVPDLIVAWLLVAAGCCC